MTSIDSSIIMNYWFYVPLETSFSQSFIPDFNVIKVSESNEFNEDENN